MTKALYEVWMHNRDIRILGDAGPQPQMVEELKAFLAEAGVMPDSELPAQVDSWAATRGLRAIQWNSIYHYRLHAR